MEILLCTDNDYVMQTGILMTSASLNNGKDYINYSIIVSEDFSIENKIMLEKTANRYSNGISFYYMNNVWSKLFPIGNEGMASYITIGAYYRLLAAEILPSHLHKILYLDSDIIVRKSLKSLWDTDIENYSVGVVRDMDERKHIEEGRLPYPMETGYFNSGVLLINLDYWREHNITEQLLNFMVKFSNIIRYHDQDVLNAVLFDSKKWLSLTYNFQNGFLYDIPEMRKYSDFLWSEILKVEKDPIILHFTFLKPWKPKCMHPQRFVWFYYKRQSLWRNVKISFPLTLREKISVFLRQNNYWFFEHKPNSIHRNIYRRVIIRK